MLLRVRVVLSSGSVARLVQLELCRQISTGRLTANSVPDALGKVSAHGRTIHPATATARSVRPTWRPASGDCQLCCLIRGTTRRRVITEPQQPSDQRVPSWALRDSNP